MIWSVPYVSVLLTQYIVFIQAQFTPEQSTINVRAVISRLNDMFGLGMNLSKIVDDYNTKNKDTYPQNDVLNQFVNKHSPNNQNGEFHYKSGVPNNDPNQYAQAPQNNGFSFQNQMVNMPNQFPPVPQNEYGNNLERNSQNNAGFIPQNQFAPQPNQFMNGFGQPMSGRGPQNGVPFGMNSNNQFMNGFGQEAGNGLLSQNSIPNNLPNQLAPKLQNDGSLINTGNHPLQISGGGDQNGGPFGMNSNNQFMNGFGREAGNVLLSQNSIPNNLQNQLAPIPQNDGSLINTGNHPLQISGGGDQNGVPFGMNSNNQFMNGFGQVGNGLLSQNSIPNNLQNQLAPKPQNDGLLINTGNHPLQISGGGPQNLGPFGFGQQNGQMSFGPMPHDLLSKNFGPFSQNAAISQNGLFNGLSLPKNFINSGMNPMSPFGFGSNAQNDMMNNLNQKNPQPSLFNMFQQSAPNNQMGSNIPTNHNSSLHFYQNEDTLFKKSFGNNYNGLSNFNELEALDKKQAQQNINVKQQQQNLQQELLRQQNPQQEKQNEQPQQINQQTPQQTPNPLQQNAEVDAFIKRMLGQDVFDYAKKELNFHHETIGKNRYPATEESLFKRVTDDKYDGITNDKYGTVSTIDYKLFKILKHPDEPIESVRKKILHQNEWVKADKNKLEDYFRDIKKDKEDRERDEMYGRVKRGVIIDETLDSKNDKTTRRTHIYEDIQLGLREWVHFGRQELSEENVTQNSTNENKEDKKRSKRAIFDKLKHYEPDYDKDEALANFANMKTEGKSKLITNFLDYCNDEKHDLNNNFHHKHDIKQRYKRDVVFDNDAKDEVLANFANMKTEGKSKLITNFLDYCDHGKHDFHDIDHKIDRKQRFKRNAIFDEFKHHEGDYDKDEALANFANMKTDGKSKLITNFLDYCDDGEIDLNKKFQIDNHKNLKEHRYKRDVLLRQNIKNDFDRDEELANFANMKSEGKNPIITNFFDYINQDNERNQKKIHGLKAKKDTMQQRFKRGAISFEKFHDFTDGIKGQHGNFEEIKDNLNGHNEIDGLSDENLVSYLKSKKSKQNELINKFLNYCDEAQAKEHNLKRKNMRRFKRQLPSKNNNIQGQVLGKDQDGRILEKKIPRKLSRQKRQSKSNDDLNLVSNDLLKKAQKFSRMQYNEIFPEILKDFEIFREATYVKSLRTAYRSNGWPAKQFKIPENPREVLPQVFRHFKYISKTNLEEYYFIMMLRLPKLIKLYQRTLNIVNRGFKEPTNGQLQGYMNREYEIETDFADFSKILRSKIFNAYLDFEDRYNEESPKFFCYETMPPFNKDPTDPPEMEKFKETGVN